MKFGLSVINAWPADVILELASTADAAGWDGFFLWDHIAFDWFDAELLDPWVLLGAVASSTERIKIGPMVTPLPRRRPQVVSKQAVTLDHLSNGRTVLGVELGGGKREFSDLNEAIDFKVRAEMLDEALEVVTGFWKGEPLTLHGKYYGVDGVTLLPKPVQQPRIPIWVGGNSRGARRRASRYDGWIMAGPAPSAGVEGLALNRVEESLGLIKRIKTDMATFDVVYIHDFPDDERRLRNLVEGARAVGVTWLLEGIYGLRYTREEALKRVEKGPMRI